MKRTLSGELPSDPSHLNPFNAVNRPEDLQPPLPADGVHNGAPAMQEPAPNDPDTRPPASPFDVDAPLPDWEEFAQMLPHTPPVENLRQASEKEATAPGEDESSVEESSAEESSVAELSSSTSDETVGKRIESELLPGHDTITFRGSSIKELEAILDILNRHPKLTVLHIAIPIEPLRFTSPMQKKLTEFFKGEHGIETLCIDAPAVLSEVSMGTTLLVSLLQSPRLKSIVLHHCYFPLLSDADRQSLIAACKANSSLKRLQLIDCISNDDLANLLEALGTIATLEELDLLGNWTRPIADSLIQLLKSNTQLKVLRISPSTPDDLRDIALLFETIKANNALEELSLLGQLWGTTSDLASLKRLAGLQSLKFLRLPNMCDMTTEAVNNVGELVKTLPALTSVQLGCLPTDQKNRLALAEALQSISRLTHVEANLGSFYSDATSDADRPIHFTQFLHALGKCPYLTSLAPLDMPSLDVLIRFLETHPRITKLHLSFAELRDPQAETKLMNLVKKSSGITGIVFHDEAGLNERQMQFVRELKAALEINRQVQRNAAAASLAMHGLLLDRHLNNDLEPFVPQDVTNELASAIARYVPPEKSKAIFDELIVHDPSYRLQ